MEVARGVGEEAVVEVLTKYTKQETEVTEVSQQLHVVFSGHNYATNLSNNRGSPCTHMHAYIVIHVNICIHAHVGSLSLSLSL